jgi:glycosyltransferase involved in cell wall biosynthesis
MAARSVWILNHYANTPEFPGPTRHVDLAKRLVKRGFQVTLVASSFRAIPGDPPRTGRERLVALDYEGVRCVWLRSMAKTRGNDASRVANMAEFAFRLWREGRTRFRGQAPRPDVIIGSTPHLFTPLAGWLLARRFRARFVVEVRDLWPETFVALGFLGAGHPIVRGLRVLERFLYRRADRIVSLLPEAWRYIAAQARVPREKVVWIPNGAASADSPEPVEASAARPFTIMYMGSQGRSNVLDDLLVASRMLQDRGAAVRVLLVGDGKERHLLEQRARALSLESLTFVDAVPKKELARLLPEADAFVALLENTPLYQYGISLNKLFDYMAAGKPVILAGDVAHNYVDLAQCGMTVPPRNPEALAQAMIELAATPVAERRAMGARGRDYVRAHHDWDLLADRFAGVLDEVVASRRPGKRNL